jgi:hypothetical protein
VVSYLHPLHTEDTSTRSLAVRFQGGEHDVGPGKQLRNGGAVSGKRFGSITVGCGGQTIRTTAGIPSGSTSSTLRWSWLTSAEAKGVMG